MAARQAVVWDGQLVDPSGIAMSVESVFSQIEQAAEAGRSVEVSYDEQLGYPTEVWIDREARAYDGGVHLLIDDLAPGLPGDTASLKDLKTAMAMWESVRPEAYEYRVNFVCDCPLSGSIWTRVDGTRIVDWTSEFAEPDETGASPITINELLEDLAVLFEAGSLEDSGVRFTGSAHYHPTLGYPTWIGLDVDVLDPTSDLAAIAPRIVFVIDEFKQVDPQSTDQGLTSAVAKWTASEIVDYEYELSVLDADGDLQLDPDGSFANPYVVTVAEGKVTSVTRNGVDNSAPDVSIYPITSLFNAIALWEQSGLRTNVIFHETLGYPVIVSVFDDTELHEFFTIRNLQPN